VKLTTQSVATLALGDRADVIHFDEACQVLEFACVAAPAAKYSARTSLNIGMARPVVASG
jgi:hypothetical protein